ncbi:MAG TPA: cytochrome P450 [Vicinamibacterales bacterium]|nr:cytochrome P450 [Vicinamibacterales bacterium]
MAAGAKLFVSPWVLRWSPRYHSDPSRFDPDRFAGDERPWSAFAYIPCGGGLRVCIGQALARMEIALALATIYRTWRLSLVPGQRIVPHPGITLTPKYSIRMLAERRHPTTRASV